MEKMDPFQADVIDRLARIETKQDTLVTTQLLHSARIEALEAFRNRILGASVLASSAASALVSLLIAHFTK
jgi:hypothetical protein